ncbi:hypothetical protein [Neobacillus soli]|uniref:hypothetical protein n=1 Tax=Neobacillus soli TaxID=220688 RepID=UPI000B2A730C|nr:hypothetical protein [Neobacillus soli]
MMYLDRNNLPPTFGELMKREREEGEKKGLEKGLIKARRKLARKLIQDNFPDEYI